MERAPDARRALAGIVAPFVFIGGWVICGAVRNEYSPTTDYISELAASDSPTRWAMSSAFVGFGVLMIVFSSLVKERVSRAAGISAIVVGAGTIAVAAFPIGSAVEGLHGPAAVVTYVSLLSLVVTGGNALGRTTSRWIAIASYALAVVMALVIVSTGSTPDVGFNQRLFLTLGDLWIIAVAALLFRSRAVLSVDDVA